jgi:KUP system potassium uptake protein
MTKSALESKTKLSLATLVIGALGVVYGDIGTSPLYALKACFTENIPLNLNNIVGVVSLIIWSLFIVVSIKYTLLIFRADNDGEGGILSLAVLCARYAKNRTQNSVIVICGIVGTALFYGDGIITPAISVLSALEGFAVVSDKLSSHTTYAAMILIFILFFLQKKGSSKIGIVFGPIMLLWFSVIGAMGLIHIIKSPQVLMAFNPYYAFLVLYKMPKMAMVILGTTVLAVTGGEALYADMGHFNKKSIRISWNFFVLPSLVLNYCGQGALLITNPEFVSNPFYFMAPSWSLYPMILLATCATIIASQAVISGVFSLSWQAIQLGYLPKMNVIHTSSKSYGQVYVPSVNYLMLTFTLAVILIFKNSDNLAYAYGLAVTALMCITTVLASILALNHWNWTGIKTSLIFGPLILLDIVFVSTNFSKLLQGGIFPILVTTIIYLIIDSWRKGSQIVYNEEIQQNDANLDDYIKEYSSEHPTRIPGTAIFLAKSPKIPPMALKAHLTHNKFLHQQVVFLSIIVEDIPKIAEKDRVTMVREIQTGIYQIFVHYGFSEIISMINISKILSQNHNLNINLLEASFFVGKNIPVSSARYANLYRWQEQIFIFLSKNTTSATDFYKIPHNRVVEIGIRHII